MEIAGNEIKTYAMDHHGLVAAVCRDIGLSSKIDKRMGKQDPRRIVSTGTAAVAMILNGLGFTNRRLYLTPQFVEGEYEKGSDENVIKLTYGHSKDNRSDLKQAVMSLVVSGASAVPIWMEPQDGNSSDKKAFHETIKKVNAFQKQLKGCPSFKWVADSALYNKDKLLKQTDYLWLSQVPETLTEARVLVEKEDKEIAWKECKKGYKMASFCSNYGDVDQRWLLIYSEQSYLREKKTFGRKLERQDEQVKKLLWHLGNEIFSCESDATKEASKLIKKFPYHAIETKTIHAIKHEKSGRPKKGAEGKVMGYQIQSSVMRNSKAIELFLNRKGRFILATNDMNKEAFSDEKMLEEYKQQQDVERGFRFLKDPWFMVDSIFLKSPRRIEALMMVMTLCLMVYNIGQYRLREALKEKNETLPNQINKPVQNPTLRWIFQIMEGISVVRFYEINSYEPVREVLANLSELRQRIIRLFGKSAHQIYGIS